MFHNWQPACVSASIGARFSQIPDGQADKYGWGSSLFSFVCMPAAVRAADALGVLANSSTSSVGECSMVAGAFLRGLG